MKETKTITVPQISQIQSRASFDIDERLSKISDDVLDIKIDLNNHLSNLELKIAVIETKIDNIEKNQEKTDKKLDESNKISPKWIAAIVAIILMTGAVLGERVWTLVDAWIKPLGG